MTAFPDVALAKTPSSVPPAVTWRPVGLPAQPFEPPPGVTMRMPDPVSFSTKIA